MEIHSPRPVASLKEFFRELLTITAGILIALSLEGMLQWKHHHDLVRQARTNIIGELRENQREMQKEQQALASAEQEVRTIVRFVHQLENNRHTSIPSFHYGFTISELHSTSWDTARTTGAVSYMPYPEVEQYAEIYDLQQGFEQLQQQAFAASLDMEGLTTLLDRKAETITQAELSDAERRLGVLLANVTAMQEIGKPLENRYTEILKTRREHRSSSY